MRIHHRDLVDGQRFSADNGATWHVTAVPLFGNVAVYADDTRGEHAPTRRVDVSADGFVDVA